MINEVSPPEQENERRSKDGMHVDRAKVPHGWNATFGGPRSNQAMYTWREDGAVAGVNRLCVALGHTPVATRFSGSRHFGLRAWAMRRGFPS
jgi:hypothetical protein